MNRMDTGSSFDLKGLAQGLVSAVLPPVCAACGRVGREPFCRICGDSVDPAPAFSIEGAASARALWLYGGPVALAVRALKYEGRPELARPLGRALRSLLVPGAAEGAIVVPVPLTPRKLYTRGYNQARELARGLGTFSVRPRALVRRSDPREQVGLDKKARLENLRGAFAPGPESIEGRAVVLLDDVVTTGATAAAAVVALKRGGASSVAVVALARAE